MAAATSGVDALTITAPATTLASAPQLPDAGSSPVAPAIVGSLFLLAGVATLLLADRRQRRLGVRL